MDKSLTFPITTWWDVFYDTTFNPSYDSSQKFDNADSFFDFEYVFGYKQNVLDLNVEKKFKGNREKVSFSGPS